MKKSLKLGKILGLLAIVFAISTAFSSCSKDDDPADNDFFIGTYKGTISYKDSAKEIKPAEGTVRVVKVGNNYNFLFTNDIPDLKGVEFEKKGDNTLVSVGSNEANYIRIDNNTLKITFLKDGKLWTANCTR